MKPFARETLKNANTTVDFPDLTKLDQQQATAIVDKFEAGYLFLMDSHIKTRHPLSEAGIVESVHGDAPELAQLIYALKKQASGKVLDPEEKFLDREILKRGKEILDFAAIAEGKKEIFAPTAADSLNSAVFSVMKPTVDLTRKDISYV